MATSVSLLGGLNVLADEAPKHAASGRKVKIGLVGCGSRGHWISPLFLKHGGYELPAVADYFPEVAAEAGREVQRRQDAAIQRALGLQEAHRQRRRGGARRGRALFLSRAGHGRR